MEETMNPATPWKQNLEAPTDQWDRHDESGDCGYISKYKGSDDYYWQTVRNNFRLAGIVVGREAAIAAADAKLALPIDDFNALVAADLIKNLRKLEQDLLILQPGGDYLPGYQAGYKAGQAAMKRKIEAVLS